MYSFLMIYGVDTAWGPAEVPSESRDDLSDIGKSQAVPRSATGPPKNGQWPENRGFAKFGLRLRLLAPSGGLGNPDAHPTPAQLIRNGS